MEIVFKAVACALVSVVLGMVVKSRNKEISLLLTIAACSVILIAVLNYLKPSIDFLQKLGEMGNLDTDMTRILLKSTGIALLSEISALICSDAGNSTLGKVLQLLAAVAILWLALPMMNQMMDLLDNIIGSV